VRVGQEFRLSLKGEARLEGSEDGILVSANGRELRIQAAAPALLGVLGRLADSGATEGELCEQALLCGDPSALFALASVLRALDGSASLLRSVVVEGQIVATLVPTASDFCFQANVPVFGKRKLSRFAYVRAERGSLHLESPLGRAMVVLHNQSVAAALAFLAQGRSLDELVDLCPELGSGAMGGILTLLQNASVLVDANDPEEPGSSPIEGSANSWWEFHDLLFHMRSRRGRHDAPYGGTYPQKNIQAPQLIKPRMTGDIVALARPDLEQLRRTDGSFTDILESRKSIREYGSEPLTVEQLSEFLYRAVRYKAVLPGEGSDHAFRTAPAGGALQELEVYPVVVRCRGLEAGIYHYRSSEHELTLVTAPSCRFERLIDEACKTANSEVPMDVYFQITARCHRVFWKYESMAYSLILKNLGALYATMYLVATAMDLAPCALGGGDSELFSSLVDLDPCEEPAVGEFALGTRGEIRT
jgi:SagB-type dehydrogenase family enzyme